MSREIAQALNDPGVRGPLEQQGILVQGLGPEEMALIIARDTETWRNFVRDYDIPQE
jgi:tripartite-type tricarboxylate transporter receptor subunit TctC